MQPEMPTGSLVTILGGFCGHGVMHSSAVGDNLTAMINGDSPPLDMRSLSPQCVEPLIDSTQL
jgi:glycine/D-amino acid oxidase-like deaminating enzyme